MKQKVWSITEEKKTKRMPAGTVPLPSLQPSPRSPLWAATLSLFLWGLGQLYNKQYREGVLFFLLMMFWASIFYFTLNLWNRLPLGSLAIFLSLTGLSLLGISFWTYQIFEAYRAANRKKSTEFSGMENALIAAVASILIPGWGQLINGQPKKATFFLPFHFLRCWLTGLFWLTPFLWQHLSVGPEKIFFEKFLLGISLTIPLIVIFCLLSISDAIKIAQHPGKREPLRKRIKYAWNRWRIKMPRVKVSKLRKRRVVLLVLLLLALAAVYLSSIYFPVKQDYLSKMTELEQKLEDAGFVIIPEYLKKVSTIFTYLI
ncbi:MAG: hypothetical protein JSU92_05220 [Deltaproteobacteria bacterium]|nr:MAG: hypothetical protein JSU92_05220 [Deltaproteobacteria bacterium]